jgi:hypothetical protein
MAKIDKILGSVSPLYGAISGQGLFGKGLVAVGDALGPAAGLMPMGASALEKRRRRKKEAGEAPEAGEGMRKGGKVKKMAKGGKVTRGDGIAKKGHTKGKMV